MLVLVAALSLVGIAAILTESFQKSGTYPSIISTILSMLIVIFVIKGSLK
jgi:hypothetical protein